MVRRESCASLTGGSPVWVSAGAPSSRLQFCGESRKAERSVKSLYKGGSNEAGRNQVNAEQASSDYQPKGDWEGRASHVMAKATDTAQETGACGGLPRGSGGSTFRKRCTEHERPYSTVCVGQIRTYKARDEIVWSREGVRGARSTEEGSNKLLEGRGPALVELGEKVSARAWA
ncbi:MAG: hypothetical protein AAB433_00515, partial [Nitrospirota bacterium]